MGATRFLSCLLLIRKSDFIYNILTLVHKKTATGDLELPFSRGFLHRPVVGYSLSMYKFSSPSLPDVAISFTFGLKLRKLTFTLLKNDVAYFSNADLVIAKSGNGNGHCLFWQSTRLQCTAYMIFRELQVP